MADEKIVVNSDPLPEIAGWAIRVVAMILGTWLVARGYITSVDTFAGYALATASAGYGLWRTLKIHGQKVKLADSSDIGVVK